MRQLDELRLDVKKAKTRDEFLRLVFANPDNKEDLFQLLCEQDNFKRLVTMPDDMAKLVYVFKDLGILNPPLTKIKKNYFRYFVSQKILND